MKPSSFYNIKIYFIILCAFYAFLPSGCVEKQVEAITRENLFTLQIGRLEDQIAFYNQDGGGGGGGLCMSEGIFYISDTEGQKVTRFNSYGDILTMIYNDETNPQPLTLKPKLDGESVTRWAFTYPFQKPGRIAIDTQKHIYVEDLIPNERRGFDPESKALLDSVALHFDADGRFLEYLGQEGIGGSPFPRIEGLYASVNDDLAVVCRLPTGWNIYWFDTDGVLLYLIKIKNGSVPIPTDRKDVVFASLDSIAAAPDARKLYIKVDYYRDTFDDSTNTRTGNESDSSVIWVMRVEDGIYEKNIETPLYESAYMENNRKVVIKIPYTLLGIAEDERVFLYFPEESGYALLILDTRESNGVQHQGSVSVDMNELQFNAFHLSREGILSAMLISDWDVKLVWWRTDKFFEDDEWQDFGFR
ncbi:MAG: hypothetical protein LBF60_07685 [Treponema sp.]|jgi:hypothetical protein|nr:hypothetical protein [Treponema sp.]